MRRSALFAVLFMVAITAARADAQAPSAPPAAQPAPNDYTQDAAWLCRPGRQDACAIDLTATVVKADGSMTREAWKPRADAPIALRPLPGEGRRRRDRATQDPCA